MNQIFVVNPKGGCGKTTIATHLAGYYANSGASIMLIDHDTQKSCSDWFNSRPQKKSQIELIIPTSHQSITSHNVDYVIHDLPATWTLANVSEIIHSQSKVLIPILPSPTDIKAALRFLISVNRSGVLEKKIKIGLLANRARVNTRYYQIQQEFLLRIGLPLVGTLRDTQNYMRAMGQGLTIFDLPPSLTKKDLHQWATIIDWLK